MKIVLMLDQPRFMGDIKEYVEGVFDGVSVELTTGIGTETKALNDGKYDLLVLEPYEFLAGEVRAAVAAARARNVPIFLITTQDRDLLDGDSFSADREYRLREVRDYDFYLLKPPRLGHVSEVIARALGIEYKAKHI
jgi:hypothetical protein